ncbi:permease [Pseudomonas paraeruginosa]|nr:permease [Pseudomonas aeruginosa]PTC37598.1 permease [Pseudomonas aeruginosa]
MLKGLIRARAGFGPMMVFLFSSPLLNPIVVGLLVATFGWTLTAIYVLAALVGRGRCRMAGFTRLASKRYVAPDGDTRRAVDVVHQASPCSATSTASSWRHHSCDHHSEDGFLRG